MRGVVVVEKRAGGGEELWVWAFVTLGVAVGGVGGCCLGRLGLELFELGGSGCDCGGLLVDGWLCCWAWWCYRCGVDLRWVAGEEIAEALGEIAHQACGCHDECDCRGLPLKTVVVVVEESGVPYGFLIEVEIPGPALSRFGEMRLDGCGWARVSSLPARLRPF